jgi:hypothetical protein
LFTFGEEVSLVGTDSVTEGRELLRKTLCQFWRRDRDRDREREGEREREKEREREREKERKRERPKAYIQAFVSGKRTVEPPLRVSQYTQVRIASEKE